MPTKFKLLVLTRSAFVFALLIGLALQSACGGDGKDAAQGPQETIGASAKAEAGSVSELPARASAGSSATSLSTADAGTTTAAGGRGGSTAGTVSSGVAGSSSPIAGSGVVEAGSKAAAAGAGGNTDVPGSGAAGAGGSDPAPTDVDAGAANDEPGPVDVPAIFMITLEVGMCGGTCPVYLASIDHAGLVHFEGRMFTVRSGPADKVVTAGAAADLYKAFVAADYWSFNDQYRSAADGCGPIASDASTLTWTVVGNGRTKRLEHYLGCTGVEGLDQVDKLREVLIEKAEISAWIK